ncbi:hypothetical protein, partial [Achromobacter insolitus]
RFPSMQFRNFSDDDLSALYERHYRKQPFHSVPRWKKITIGIASTVFPLLGIAAVFSMLERAPTAISIMVGLGVIGGICLALVLRAERQFLHGQREIVDELVRRGLYERPIPPGRGY